MLFNSINHIKLEIEKNCCHLQMLVYETKILNAIDVLNNSVFFFLYYFVTQSKRTWKDSCEKISCTLSKQLSTWKLDFIFEIFLPNFVFWKCFLMKFYGVHFMLIKYYNLLFVWVCSGPLCSLLLLNTGSNEAHAVFLGNYYLQSEVNFSSNPFTFMCWN